MTKGEFAAELGGIIRLLREHEFLAYSPSGRTEYEQKLRSCESLYTNLVARKTGLPVFLLPGILPIETVRDATYSAGRGLALRAEKLAAAEASRNLGRERERYLACAALWGRAASKLAEPDPRP